MTEKVTSVIMAVLKTACVQEEVLCGLTWKVLEVPIADKCPSYLHFCVWHFYQ